jgi:bacillithiol biosynthesis cysteine-adding enzyme BshC
VARAFSSSFLVGEAEARAFLDGDFRAPAERAARTRAAAARRVPAALLEVLRQQQAALAAPGSAARQVNLDALAAGGAALVVTGQQVGLFLGPLYAFYKAASAVAVARALERETGVRVVPLFWLQTEDHDFAEIASTTVAGRDGRPVRLALAPEPPELARVSIAHRTLGPEVTALVAALGDVLGAGPAAEEAMALAGACYQPGRPLAAAFAGLLATLFAPEGLLVLDPREARVATLAAPLYRRALDGAAEIAEAIRARGAALAAAGFEQQIPPRPDCALLFYHPDGPAGPRFRLQPPATPGGDWTLAGSHARVKQAALARALEEEPLRFSTSALLRPLVQDTLLPTAAYVGGPAELSYFAQLGPVYAALGVPLPLIVPRARFRCLDARARRLLAELGLRADDLAAPRAALLARCAAARPAGAPDPAALANRVAATIAPTVDEIAGAVAAADPGLERAAARTRATVARALSRLTDRYARHLVERDQVARDRLERLEAALQPGGAPQERVYGWPSLAGRHGPGELKRLVLADLETTGPFATGLRDLLP